MTTMDELSVFAQHLSSHERMGRRRGRPAKRESCPEPVLSTTAPKRAKHSLSSDEGIDLSLDPMNDSIALSVKRRQRNPKQFDSKLFYNSVVKSIERKYKKSDREDAVIDLNDMQIIGSRGSMEERDQMDFGYFADNTLEELRQKSFKSKRLFRSPLEESTPNTSKAVKAVVSSAKQLAKTPKQTVPQKLNSNTRGKEWKNCNTSKQLISANASKRMVTNIMIAEEESDEESVDSNESEELEENHPLMKYENLNVWSNKDYQIDCLNKTIEMLKNDTNGHFKDALKERVFLALNLPVLPNGSNVTPVIKYNVKGEPNFEFFFGSAQSPLEVRDVLQIDYRIIVLSKVIYDWIQLKTNHKNAKRLSYSKKQLQFNH
ncbi:unnamed protein product, partial [Medioppia subpectinata]